MRYQYLGNGIDPYIQLAMNILLSNEQIDKWSQLSHRSEKSYRSGKSGRSGRGTGRGTGLQNRKQRDNHVELPLFILEDP